MKLLESQIMNCERCDLALKRKRAIPGEGPLGARVFLLGQAPFDAEEMNGRPFWGVTGAFLRYFLGRAGVNFYECWRTNLLKCPLPRYGRPKWRQIDACLPYLKEEIECVRPKVIVPLGKWALKACLPCLACRGRRKFLDPFDVWETFKRGSTSFFLASSGIFGVQVGAVGTDGADVRSLRVILSNDKGRRFAR